MGPVFVNPEVLPRGWRVWSGSPRHIGLKAPHYPRGAPKCGREAGRPPWQRRFPGAAGSGIKMHRALPGGIAVGLVAVLCCLREKEDG